MFGVLWSVLEIVGRKWRPVISSLHMCTWAVSCMILPLIAYVIRDAFQLQLVLSVPSFVLLIFFW